MEILMIKRCLQKSELQTKACKLKQYNFLFLPRPTLHPFPLCSLYKGANLFSYLASTCIQVMESPKRKEREVRLFSPFLQGSLKLAVSFHQRSRSYSGHSFPSILIPSSGKSFLFLFLLRHAASLGGIAIPWRTYLVISLHPPLPLFIAPLLNGS